MKVCELCHGRGVINKIKPPDFTKALVGPSKALPDENDFPKIYQDFCPVCHGAGHVDGSAAFVENHDYNVVQ